MGVISEFAFMSHTIIVLNQEFKKKVSAAAKNRPYYFPEKNLDEHRFELHYEIFGYIFMTLANKKGVKNIIQELHDIIKSFPE